MQSFLVAWFGVLLCSIFGESSSNQLALWKSREEWHLSPEMMKGDVEKLGELIVCGV